MPADEPADANTIDDLANEMVDSLTNSKATNLGIPNAITQGCRQIFSPNHLPPTRGGASAQECSRGGSKHTRMTKEERVHTTTWTGITMPVVDDTEHIVDKDLVTESEDKLKV